MEFTKITSVEVLGHYRLRLGFSDGISRDVDLAGELRGPVFESLADPEFFAQVREDDELGTVVWPTAPTSTRSSCTATSSRPHTSCITRAAQTRLADEARSSGGCGETAFGIKRAMAQRKTLTQQRVALLRWVAGGCSDGEMEEYREHPRGTTEAFASRLARRGIYPSPLLLTAESNRRIGPLVQGWLVGLLLSAYRPKRSAWSRRIRGHGDSRSFPPSPFCEIRAVCGIAGPKFDNPCRRAV